jgi:outer membrane protein
VSPVFRRILIPSLLLFAFTAGTASAQSPEWRWGGRLSWVGSGATSEELGDTGGGIKLHSGYGFELDAALRFSDRFGVELSVGVSTHRLCVVGGDWGDIDGGRLWLVPLTVIAQYHQPVYGPWDPYFGLGVSWIVPLYSESQELTDAGVRALDLDGGAGLAAQLGVNYHLDHRWYANVDLRYLGSSLDARVRMDEGDLPPVALDVNPVVVSLGFGYKF